MFVGVIHRSCVDLKPFVVPSTIAILNRVSATCVTLNTQDYFTESEESYFDMMPAHVLSRYYRCDRRRLMSMRWKLYALFSIRVEVEEEVNLREDYNPSGRTCSTISGLDGSDARKRRCAQEKLYFIDFARGSRDAHALVFCRCFRGLFVADRCLSLSYP